MSTAAELLQLAERCEREEPSLLLRCDIAKALGWREVKHDCHIRYIDLDGRMRWATEIPDWPGNLDAAVTLVPPNCWRETNGPRRYLNIPSSSPNYWHCNVTVWEPKMRDHHGWGATEALSICAAALRARAAAAGKP